MNEDTQVPAAPRLLPLAHGGWLAFSPAGSQFRFGVTGQTEEGAARAYAETWDRWRAILAASLPETTPDA